MIDRTPQPATPHTHRHNSAPQPTLDPDDFERGYKARMALDTLR